MKNLSLAKIAVINHIFTQSIEFAPISEQKFNAFKVHF